MKATYDEAMSKLGTQRGRSEALAIGSALDAHGVDWSTVRAGGDFDSGCLAQVCGDDGTWHWEIDVTDTGLEVFAYVYSSSESFLKDDCKTADEAVRAVMQWRVEQPTP